MNGTEVNPRYSENALKEKAFLQELNKKPPLQKFFGYCKLSGPGFMNAAFTLGAGSFASSVTLGAAYGYDMLWIPLYSFALGLFMLALATRFVTASEISVIKAQDKFHGKFFGSFATGLVACFVASIVYNFGQYALGADAVTALFSVVNINVPKNISWILLVAISVPLSLMYGSGDNPKGVKIVENAMKILIGIMLVVFGAVLCVTGVDFKAMIKGLLIPTLPSGIDGIVMLIASLTATIGVMDWVLFNNGMESRGYSENHETLGRFDAVFGGLIPVTLVLSFVSIAFAEAFAGQEGIPHRLHSALQCPGFRNSVHLDPAGLLHRYHRPCVLFHDRPECYLRHLLLSVYKCKEGHQGLVPSVHRPGSPDRLLRRILWKACDGGRIHRRHAVLI